MYLKVQTQENPVFWRYFDDVYGLIYGVGSEGLWASGIRCPEVIRHEIAIEAVVEDQQYLYASFVSHGEPVELITCGKCYLLGDDGTTLERLK